MNDKKSKNKFLIIFLIALVTALAIKIYYVYTSLNASFFAKELDETSNSKFSFGSTHVNFLDKVGTADIEINDFSFSDSLCNSLNSRTITAKKIVLSISMANILNKHFKILAISVYDGKWIERRYEGNEILSATSKSLIDTLFDRNVWVEAHKAYINLDKFIFDIYDYEKNKNYEGIINKINGEFELNEWQLQLNANIKGQINKLGFNLDKGTFFNGANIAANIKGEYDFNKQIINIPEINLLCDTQEIKAQAKIDVIENEFEFLLKLPQANYKYCVSLLPQNIQKRLLPFNFKNTLNLIGKIKGNFAYKSNPWVNIKYRTENNKIIGKEFEVDDVFLDGDFSNTLTEDYEIHQKRVSDINLRATEAKGIFHGIPFRIESFDLNSTPENKVETNFRLQAHGKPNYIGNLFQKDLFELLEGNFELDINYSGRIGSVKDVIVNANGNFLWTNGSFFYNPKKINIPIDSMNLDLKKGDALLNMLKFPTNNIDFVEISGLIYNFSNLFDVNSSKSKDILEEVKIISHLRSSRLDWDDVLKMFSIEKTKKQEISDVIALKSAIKDIYEEIHPTSTISIDTFVHQKKIIRSLKGTLEFKNKDVIKLDDAYANIAGGSMLLDFSLDMKDSGMTHFDANFEAENIQLGPFFKEFNYFHVPSLILADTIEGIASITTQLYGTIYDDSTGLDTRSISGPISFEVKELQLDNFEPLMKIGSKIFSKSRMSEVSFAQINNDIYLEGGNIYVPRMEVQSSAFVFFVEGRLNSDNCNNLWITIPWKNLKRWDKAQDPEKIGYANNGKKFFIQMYNKKFEDNVSYRFRLRNKGIYKELGIEEKYKYDRDENKRRFKYYKKTNRQIINDK